MNFIYRSILYTNVKPYNETWQSRRGKVYFWDKNVAFFQMTLLSLYLSQRWNDVWWWWYQWQQNVKVLNPSVGGGVGKRGWLDLFQYHKTEKFCSFLWLFVTASAMLEVEAIKTHTIATSCFSRELGRWIKINNNNEDMSSALNAQQVGEIHSHGQEERRWPLQKLHPYLGTKRKWPLNNYCIIKTVKQEWR